MGAGNSLIAYDRLKAQFSEWAETHSHNILTSFPKSGRNYLGSMLRRASHRKVMNGLPGQEDALDFSEVYLFVLHRQRWELRGDKGNYILLIRDPRDAILSRTYTEANTRGAKVGTVIEDDDWMETNVREWEAYFDTFLSHKCHPVQYEELCLFPVETLSGIFDYLNIEPVVDLLTVAKEDDQVKPDPLKENDFVNCNFATGFERYRRHCLKWQRDPHVTEAYLQKIWRSLHIPMERYGYSNPGHATSLFSKCYSREVLKTANI